MTALPQLLRLVLWNAFNIVVTLTSNRPYILMPPPQIFYAQVPPPPPLQHPIKYPFRRSTQLLWNVSNLNIPVSSDWKPLTLPLRQFITTAYTTTTTITTPSPLQPLTGSLNDNPVFESIVYGTWKLEPTMIYPKHFKKTVNRQYGGFLGNIASKKSIKTNEPSYTLNISYNASDAFQEVSTKKSFKNQEKQQHNVTKKSQRLQTTTHHQRSFVESSTTALYSATTSKKLDKQLLKTKASITTTTTVNVKEQPEITTIINVQGEPELAPEITTIMTTAPSATTTIDIKHVQYKNNTFNIEEMTNAAAIEEASTDNPTTIPKLNWPSDFIDGHTEQVTTITTEEPMNTENISHFIPEQLIEHTSEFLIELKALKVPPSLWPRLPQNITKLGMPYATNNLTEEPALCVPTISQEENQSQPKQIIDVERVYCFPLSDNTTSTQLSFNGSDSLENTTNEIVKSLPSKAYRRRLDNVIFIVTVYLYLYI